MLLDIAYGILVLLSVLIGCVCAVVMWSRRVAAILSPINFMTVCEVVTRYNQLYRPWFFLQDSHTIAYLLEAMEKARVVVGRDTVQVRCDCVREYCLSMNYRRRRRVLRKEPARLPGEVAIP